MGAPVNNASCNCAGSDRFPYRAGPAAGELQATSGLTGPPIFVALAVATALDVQYRDIRSASLVQEQYRFLYGLNPMAGVVEGFRWAATGRGEPPGPMLVLSVGVIALALISGLFYFRRMERTFADVI